MAQRSTYQTKQKTLVLGCMEAHPDAYLSVDEVCSLLASQGHEVGRTTVYRTLEAAAKQGTLAKVVGKRGDAIRYRAWQPTSDGEGQLYCVRCGEVFPLACDTLQEFASHVAEHHGFAIDRSRTVLYGLCAQCQALESESPVSLAAAAPRHLAGEAHA